MSVPAPATLVRLRHLERRAFLAGAVLTALAALGGALFGAGPFFRAWLLAAVFWLGIAVGCLGIAMMHQLTGGQWGTAIERLLEAAARTVPWLALAFVPIVLWLPALYPWARPATVAAEAGIQHKHVYLNLPFFVVRAVLYFAAWTAMAWLLHRWSRAQDRTAEPRATTILRRVSAPGVIVFGVTASFAAIDWVMSLEPLWYSTVYGGMVGVGWMLSAFAFAILVATRLADRPPFDAVMTAKVRIDLGNLLLTFVVLWGYLNFAQLLISWSGNTPEEVAWYVHRLRGGWQGIGVFLAVFQFLVPLLALLFRPLKRHGGFMLGLTGLVLFAHWVDVLWLVEPAFHPGAFGVHWLDFVASLGLGGLWLGLFARLLRGVPLVPLHDPALPVAELQHAQ